MALTRPLKEGSVTTYQQKVAAGFPDILASEADADLDTIYAAWNGGIGTANLVDGSVTSAKLAPGAALANLSTGSITTAKLAPGAASRSFGTTSLPVAYSSSTAAWTVFHTVNLTTSGGLVMLLTVAGWYVFSQTPNTIHKVSLGWCRDSTSPTIAITDYCLQVPSAAIVRVPLPTFIGLDQPGAGAHAYKLAVYCSSANVAFFTSDVYAGATYAVELA
jgi:hypothetical protein